MSRTRLLLASLLLLSGCRGGPVVQQTDRILLEMASRPFDLAPPETAESKPKSAQRAGVGHSYGCPVASGQASGEPAEL